MRILLLVLAIFPCFLPAQTITARLDLSRRDAQPSWLEYCPRDGGLVTVGNSSRKSSRYQSVTKYDEGFHRTWAKPVLTQNGNSSVDLLAVLGDLVYVFISEYYPREGSIKTSYSTLDMEGNLLEERVVIDELANEKGHRVDLRYERSLNKQKLLCYRNLALGNRNEKLVYYLFDAATDSVVSGSISLPYPDEKFQVRKIVVSNNGEIYLLGKYYLVSKIKSPQDYGFKLYRYLPGETEGDQVNMELGELFINDLTLKGGRDNNLYLAGFYSHHSSDEIIGTCFFRVNPDLEQEVQSTQRFSDEFLMNFMRESQIDRGKELRNFYLDNIILRSDSGALLIAEKYYTSYNSFVDMYGYMVDQRIHHYDDIIVSSVASSGDLEWCAVARKRQQSESRDHLSYLEVVSDENLYLLYSYDPPKENRSIYFNTVDMQGNVSVRKPLLGAGSVDDLFYPNSSEQISNNEALLYYYSERTKVFSIVKMEF